MLQNQPWLSHKANVVLYGLVERDWDILEIGSGGSSIWFARRCKSIISIEHNQKWYNEVKAEAPDNLDVQLHQAPFHLNDELWEQFSPQSFDMILVDGHEPRPECAQRAYQYLKEGGIFILDDAQRANYHWAIQDLAHWDLIKCEGGGQGDPWRSTFIWTKKGPVTKIHVPSKDKKIIEVPDGEIYTHA